MEPSYAETVLRAHFASFNESGCKGCDGNCCSHCASANGYLEDYATEATILRLKAKYGWNSETGFRGQDGCTLPITQRSPTCLTYYCGDKRQWSPDGSGFHDTFTGKRLGLQPQHQKPRQLTAIGRLRELLQRKFQEE